MSQSSSPSQKLASLIEPWRPWSVPINLVYVRRKLCGLLNKLTTTNFHKISDQIVTLAVAIERNEDPVIVDCLVSLILDRGITDGSHSHLYGSLCQKLVDELEGERTRWRKVDLYHLGNPIHSFETAIQALMQREFERIVVQETRTELCALVRFLGELLVHGVLFPGDIADIMETLFSGIEGNSESHVVALSGFLSPILRAPDASRILEELAIIEGLDRVLQEDSLSLKVRLFVMNMLDQAIDPKPHDTFTPLQRNEIYGLDVEIDDADVPIAQLDKHQSPSALRQQCYDKAHSFLSTRRLALAEDFFMALEQKHRHIFVASLVSLALSSNDYSDAALVASLLSQESVRRLCGPGDTYVRGFESELFSLEDTALDVPHAYNLMAIMLHACKLSQRTVEDMASRIVVRENKARDRLMHEYLALEVAEDILEQGNVFYHRMSREVIGDDDPASMDDPSSELQTVSSDIGYAY